MLIHHAINCMYTVAWISQLFINHEDYKKWNSLDSSCVEFKRALEYMSYYVKINSNIRLRYKDVKLSNYLTLKDRINDFCKIIREDERGYVNLYRLCVLVRDMVNLIHHLNIDLPTIKTNIMLRNRSHIINTRCFLVQESSEYDCSESTESQIDDVEFNRCPIVSQAFELLSQLLPY